MMRNKGSKDLCSQRADKITERQGQKQKDKESTKTIDNNTKDKT